MIDVTEDEKAYTLGEGNIIFHAPMEFHRIRSSKGSAPKGFIFSFEVTGDLPDILKAGIFSMDIQQRRLFDELRAEINDFVHSDRSSEAGTRASSLLKLFILKIAEAPLTLPASTSQSALEYQRVISFMANEVKENLTLDEIAKRNHISVSYMKYLFNMYAGIGPKHFFNMLRIKAAEELLNKGHSVTEVSIIMNFSSPNYFSVFYKRYTGISPSLQHNRK
jgi:AraC-like DNA-binding protein